MRNKRNQVRFPGGFRPFFQETSENLALAPLIKPSSIHWLPTLRPPYPLPRLCCCWTRRCWLNWCPVAGFACCCGTVLMRWAFICAKSASIVLGAAWFCVSLAFPFWKASLTGLLCTKVLVLHKNQNISHEQECSVPKNHMHQRINSYCSPSMSADNSP